MTLTEAAYWTRRFGVLTAGALVLIICGLTAFFIFRPDPLDETQILVANYGCTATRDEFIENRLIIPSLQLSTNEKSSIKIDTPSGQTDALPQVANVYEYDHSGPSLIAQKKAQDIGNKLGFDPEEIKRRGTIEYYWEEDNYGRRLSINANTLNFKLDTNFVNPSSLPEEMVLPSDNEAMQVATSFMRGNGWLLTDYTQSEPELIHINIEPDGSYSMAQSRAEAELIRIDFYRAKPFLMFRTDLTNANQIKASLDEKFYDYESVTESVKIDDGNVDVISYLSQVVHQDTQKSNISVYVGPQYKKDTAKSSPNNIYAIDYLSWVIPEEPCGTYPLISTATLINQIENNEASLVYLNEADGDIVVPHRPREVSNLSVKEISLAYLDTPEQQRFHQPIYIIKGDAVLDNGVPGRFYFYMPAINYESLEDRAVVEESSEVSE